MVMASCSPFSRELGNGGTAGTAHWIMDRYCTAIGPEGLHSKRRIVNVALLSISAMFHLSNIGNYEVSRVLDLVRVVKQPWNLE